MTDNSDFASRPQHPEAAPTPPVPGTPSTSPQGSTSAEQSHGAPAAPQSPFARPHADGGQPAYGAPQPDHAAAQPTATYPFGPAAQPTAHPTGATPQPTATYHSHADGQPTTQYPLSAPVQDPQRSKGGKTIPLVVGALVVGALAGGASGAGIAALALNNLGTAPQSASSSPTTVTVNQPDNATVVTAAAATVAPSTVTLFVNAEVGSGSGSGVVISDDGYIVTNSHVVTLGGATADPEIQVQTYDGRLLDATIVGRDPIADIAVVKVESGSGLQPAEWDDSDQLNVGDTTVAVGAPLGLANSVSSGIVSALNRSITVASSEVPEEIVPENGPEQSPPPFDFWNFDIPGQDNEPSSGSQRISLAVIQTDAAINQGNSGGALVNEAGRVIGINVAIASTGGEQGGNIGLGFAIPSNLAQRVAQELIENGKASHGLLGASVTDATTDSSVDAAVVGAVIKQLTDGGAAAQAGLRVGDIVTGVNGIPVTSSTDLTAQIRALAAGAEAEISFVRGTSAQTVQVTLGELL